MKRPIFYFERFKAWDICTIAIYTIVSLAVYLIRNNSVLLFYSLCTQLFFYLFNYRSLRNFSVYLVWLAFGIVHLAVYLYSKDNSSFDMANGGTIDGLRNTIMMLFVFQLLRILSLNIQHQEFVMPSRGGGIDLFDERSQNWLDFVLFVLYVVCAVVLIMLR